MTHHDAHDKQGNEHLIPSNARRRIASIRVLLALTSLWILAIIASNCSCVLPVGSYSSLSVVISARSFSNSASRRFLVSEDGDGAGGTYFSGESYTTSVPDDGEQIPTAEIQLGGGRSGEGGFTKRSSGGDGCRINQVACNQGEKNAREHAYEKIAQCNSLVQRVHFLCADSAPLHCCW